MKLNCHCGAVEAEINATINELAKIVKCNCSICKRKNATMGMVKNEDFNQASKVTRDYIFDLNIIKLKKQKLMAMSGSFIFKRERE